MERVALRCIVLVPTGMAIGYVWGSPRTMRRVYSSGTYESSLLEEPVTCLAFGALLGLTVSLLVG